MHQIHSDALGRVTSDSEPDTPLILYLLTVFGIEILKSISRLRKLTDFGPTG